MSKFHTIDAPAYWASAIINHDYSGLDAKDRAELNNWLLFEGLSFVDCLDCSEEFIGRFNGLLCNLATYTFNKRA